MIAKTIDFLWFLGERKPIVLIEDIYHLYNVYIKKLPFFGID